MRAYLSLQLWQKIGKPSLPSTAALSSSSTLNTKYVKMTVKYPWNEAGINGRWFAFSYQICEESAALQLRKKFKIQIFYVISEPLFLFANFGRKHAEKPKKLQFGLNIKINKSVT